MKKLDYNDYLVCKMQGKLFEMSLTKCNTSSAIFIRRFMKSKIASSFDDKSILVSSVDLNEIFNLLDEEFGPSSYGKTKFDNNKMYWIGYFYRVLCLYYHFSSKTAYRYFPVNEIE